MKISLGARFGPRSGTKHAGFWDVFDGFVVVGRTNADFFNRLRSSRKLPVFGVRLSRKLGMARGRARVLFSGLRP